MKYNLLYASALAVPFALLTAGGINAQAADTTTTPTDNVATVANQADQALSDATTTGDTAAETDTPIVASTQTANTPLTVTNDPTAPDSDPEADARVAEGIAKAAGTQTFANDATDEDASATQASSDNTASNSKTEGNSYWIANPDYSIWDTPYTSTSNKVADASSYTHTAFKGLGQATNESGNVYENITNNDNVTGWIYLPALTTTDPNAKADETPAKKNVLDKVKDTADKVSGFNTSIKSAVDSTQDLIQEPGSVITKAITKPFDNVSAINKSISTAIASPFTAVKTVGDAISGATDTVTAPFKKAATGIKNVVSKVTGAASGATSGISSAVSSISSIIQKIAGLAA